MDEEQTAVPACHDMFHDMFVYFSPDLDGYTGPSQSRRMDGR